MSGNANSGRRREPPYQRFWRLAKYSEIGCWNWRGRLRGTAPQFWDGEKPMAAARFAWEHANGPVPEGCRVMRTCRNKRCVRPSHLRLG